MVMDEQYAAVFSAMLSKSLFTVTVLCGESGELETADTTKQCRPVWEREMQAVKHKLEEMAQQAHPDHWLLLTVQPGKEQQARDSFRRYGVRCYWPNYYIISRWSPQLREKRRTDFRSVMPGYLFVPSPATTTIWNVIEHNIGVVNVVRNYSGELAVLRNADVEVIRSIEAGMNTPKPGKALHNFKTGDKVRFNDDTLNRWPPGLVAGSLSDGRISVEVEVMGRIVPIQVFPHQIERA